MTPGRLRPSAARGRAVGDDLRRHLGRGGAHVIEVAGIVLDTVHGTPTPPGGTGPRWQPASEAAYELATGSFVTRHPRGYDPPPPTRPPRLSPRPRGVRRRHPVAYASDVACVDPQRTAHAARLR